MDGFGFLTVLAEVRFEGVWSEVQTANGIARHFLRERERDVMFLFVCLGDNYKFCGGEASSFKNG